MASGKLETLGESDAVVLVIQIVLPTRNGKKRWRELCHIQDPKLVHERNINSKQLCCTNNHVICEFIHSSNMYLGPDTY